MRYVTLEHLEEGMVLARDVFETGESVTPLVREGKKASARLVNVLRKRGIQGVYVQTDEPDLLLPDVEQAPPAIDERLRDEALDTLETFFEGIIPTGGDAGKASAQIVQRMDSVVDRLVDSIVSDRDALLNISNLRSYDDYTYHHSLSVAVLSIAIGQNLGLGSQDLNLVGMCAMMHDIGKTAIPIEIIRKPSRLDDDEFTLIKTHSSAGYRYLAQLEIADEPVRQGVLHHHEKVDGTGYPLGIRGSEIPMLSRIISVADVYDALTSNRPYRQPMLPSDAMEYIMGGAGTSFDFDVVSALVSKVAFYPVGSIIELSDGRVGTVLSDESPMRPVVMLHGTNEVLDLYNDRRLFNIVVKRLVGEHPQLSAAAARGGAAT